MSIKTKYQEKEDDFYTHLSTLFKRKPIECLIINHNNNEQISIQPHKIETYINMYYNIVSNRPPKDPSSMPESKYYEEYNKIGYKISDSNGFEIKLLICEDGKVIKSILEYHVNILTGEVSNLTEVSIIDNNEFRMVTEKNEEIIIRFN